MHQPSYSLLAKIQTGPQDCISPIVFGRMGEISASCPIFSLFHLTFRSMLSEASVFKIFQCPPNFLDQIILNFTQIGDEVNIFQPVKWYFARRQFQESQLQLFETGSFKFNLSGHPHTFSFLYWSKCLGPSKSFGCVEKMYKMRVDPPGVEWNK